MKARLLVHWYALHSETGASGVLREYVGAIIPEATVEDYFVLARCIASLGRVYDLEGNPFVSAFGPDGVKSYGMLPRAFSTLTLLIEPVVMQIIPVE